MEPTLSQIDDYNGNESPKKRRVVNLVVATLFGIGVIYTMAKITFDSAPDEIPHPVTAIPYAR